MRPYLLKGHERPLTQVKYNREGDLLISCAKNQYPCLWLADDGMRLGTYEGHNGAVWTCDMSMDSQRLITSSADQTVRIWELPTGRELHQIRMNEPCRASALNIGETLLAFTTDSFMGAPPQIHLVDVDMQVRRGSGAAAMCARTRARASSCPALPIGGRVFRHAIALRLLRRQAAALLHSLWPAGRPLFGRAAANTLAAARFAGRARQRRDRGRQAQVHDQRPQWPRHARDLDGLQPHAHHQPRRRLCAAVGRRDRQDAAGGAGGAGRAHVLGMRCVRAAVGGPRGSLLSSGGVRPC